MVPEHWRVRASATAVPTACCLLALLLATPHVYADGVCEKGDRDTTAAERETMTNVLESVKAALPQAPDGWIIGGYEELSVRQSICSDFDATPWAYNFTRIYNRADDAAEREQALAKAREDMRASMAAGTFNEDSSQAHADAINAIMMQDRTMEIAVSINPSSVSSNDWPSSTAPSGAQSAFRGQTTDQGVTNGHALVLFGNWQPREGGGLEPTKRGNASSAAAHAIAVKLTADPARLDTLLSAVDFGSVAPLVR